MKMEWTWPYDLDGRMGLFQVKEVARSVSESRELLDFLWETSYSKDRRVSVNSLWILTHLEDPAVAWLRSRQSHIIDRLLSETDPSRKRIFLQLLREQEFDLQEESSIRLLDFCLTKINAECEPYAVRCFSIYVAFKICRTVPELLGELEQHLDLLSMQQLSPGLRSGLRQTRKKITSLRKHNHETENSTE